MLPNKQVIVVHPKDYEELGIRLQHAISKEEGFDSVAWTIDLYRQNMPTLSGRSYVIFIGNAEENPFSKIYLSQIAKVVNLHGACFGRDGTKAVVFGEGKLEKYAAFEAAKNNVMNNAKASGSIGAAVAFAFIGATPIVTTAFSGAGGLAMIGYQLTKYFKRKREADKLRYEQTQFAITRFVQTELDAWFETEDCAS